MPSRNPAHSIIAVKGRWPERGGRSTASWPIGAPTSTRRSPSWWCGGTTRVRDSPRSSRKSDASCSRARGAPGTAPPVKGRSRHDHRSGLVARSCHCRPATGWGALVLFYLAPGSERVRTALAWSFVALGLVALGGLAVRRARGRRSRLCRGLRAGAGSSGAARNRRTTATGRRKWPSFPMPLSTATCVTVHNIRNFDYRTETDSRPRTTTARSTCVAWTGSTSWPSTGWGRPSPTCSLPSASAMSTWPSPSRCARRTKPYATLPGFFRQYELVYVVADERDVIRVRTNYRKSPPEEVYLFRMIGPIENGRRIFLDYMRDINELRERPRFYNTLTTNCTTMILGHAAVNPDPIPYSWKVLAERLCARVHLRQRTPRPESALRRVEAARPYQLQWPRPRTRHRTSPGASGPMFPEAG